MESKRESYQDLLRRCTKRKKCDNFKYESELLPTLHKGDVIELYGGHVTGATTILSTVAMEYLLNNTSARVLYIDCDRGVSPHKFNDILLALSPEKDVDEVLQRLLISNCCNIHDLLSVLNSVEKQFKQDTDYADVVIIDNIMSFYWSSACDKTTLRDKIIPKLQSIKPHCSLMLSWHPPVKQTDNILPTVWFKLVSRRLCLSNQANPRSMIEEGECFGQRHCVQFDIDVRSGRVNNVNRM